jgi:hypothetical protein
MLSRQGKYRVKRVAVDHSDLQILLEAVIFPQCLEDLVTQVLREIFSVNKIEGLTLIIRLVNRF